MRERKWRFVIVGAVMIVAALAFFIGMADMSPRSNDPGALMETVGQVSGVFAALGLVMIVLGLIGRRRPG